MYETHLTAVGTLITVVDKRRFADGTTKVSFRIACNERRFDKGQNGWVDGDTLYMSVSCWRDLADNVHASFMVGDPIIVRGRLLTREWEKDGKRNSITELEASAVGPDLSRCTTKIMRTKRAGASADGASAAAGNGSSDSVAGRRQEGGYALADLAAVAAADAPVAVAASDPWQPNRHDGAVAVADYDDDWPGEGVAEDSETVLEAAVGS